MDERLMPIEIRVEILAHPPRLAPLRLPRLHVVATLGLIGGHDALRVVNAGFYWVKSGEGEG